MMGLGVQTVGMLSLYLDLGASRSLQPTVEVCTQSPHYTALEFPVKTYPVQFLHIEIHGPGKLNRTRGERWGHQEE